jgi:S-methylmethionine-dependent homocysteine/selenocysteine methylase
MAGRSDELTAILRRNESVLMDGALGTELERRGLPIEGRGWSALAVRDHGEVIRDIHRDYLDAGARLHIVNSFALARHVLEPIGLGAQFTALNRRAVELFDEAVDAAGAERGSLWAVGSISTFCANSDRSLLPKGDSLIANCRDQAQVLRAAGVDLFALEMLFDIDVTLAMLQAVSEFDVPVIVGFTCGLSEHGDDRVTTRPGLGLQPQPLAEVLSGVVAASDPRNLILSIMHSDADATDAALQLLRRHWDGPVAIYPNSGHFVDLQLQFDSVCSAVDFAHAADGWLRQGVQIVGGCCGIGPSHIRRLSGKLDYS